MWVSTMIDDGRETVYCGNTTAPGLDVIHGGHVVSAGRVVVLFNLLVNVGHDVGL